MDEGDERGSVRPGLKGSFQLSVDSSAVPFSRAPVSGARDSFGAGSYPWSPNARDQGHPAPAFEMVDKCRSRILRAEKFPAREGRENAHRIAGRRLRFGMRPVTVVN